MDRHLKTKNKRIQFRVFCCGERRLLVLANANPLCTCSWDLIMLIITVHRSNTVTVPLILNKRHSDLLKNTHTNDKCQSLSHFFSVFVCVCALNVEYIYLRSAEVMGFGSCVILFDLLLTYDEFCCTSNLKKMNVDLRLQCHISRRIDTSGLALMIIPSSVSLWAVLSSEIRAAGRNTHQTRAFRQKTGNYALMISGICCITSLIKWTE